MPNLYRTYFLLAFILILTGCSQNNINNTPEVKTEPIIIEKNSKVEEKAKVIKKKIVKKKIKKKVITYKYCKKYITAMNHASNYIENEFEKGYFLQKDIIGAKAQLFLIENKSPSVFAANINAAQESYLKNHIQAKKNKCNVKKFRTSPIDKIKNKIKSFEKQKEKR